MADAAESGVAVAAVGRGAPRFGHATLSSGALHAVSGVMLAISGVLTARALGPDDRGVFALIALAVALTAYTGVLGVDLYATREYGQLGPSRAVDALIRAHGVVAVGGVLAGLAVLVGLIPNDARALACIAASYAAAAILSALAVSRPLGLRRMRVYGAAVVCEAAVPLAVVGLAVAMRVSSVALVLTGFAAGRIISMVTSVAGTRDRRKSGVSPAPGICYRAALKFGIPVAAGALLTVALLRLDAVLVQIFRGTADVGVYTAVAVLTEMLLLAPNGVAAVLLPHVAGNGGHSATESVVRIATTLVAILGLMLVVAGPWLVPFVLGEGYEAGWVALPGLVVAAVFLCCWRLITADLAGRSRTVVRVSSAGVGLVVMIGSDLVLIPPFGIIGASVGAALGYFAATAICVREWTAATGESAFCLVGMRGADARRLGEILLALGIRTRRGCQRV